MNILTFAVIPLSGVLMLVMMALGMVRLIAPILSFTAEEIWRYLPKESVKEKSVHLSLFPEEEALKFDDKLTHNWELLIQLKSEVSKASEVSRRNKVIGHSLDSIVKLELPPEIEKNVRQYLEELKFLFIVSNILK